MRALRFGLLIGAIYCGSSFSVVGKVIYVAQTVSGDGSGSTWRNAFVSITAGLANSISGDEIWVAAGRYNESIQMKEGVALYGGFRGTENARSEREWAVYETIVDADGLKRTAVFGANAAVLDGFIIMGGAAERGGGVSCLNASPTLIHCTIMSNSAAWYGSGIYCADSAPNLDNCTIKFNTSDWSGGGIYCATSSPTLTGCTIIFNKTARHGAGVYCESLSNPVLTDCNISYNTSGWTGGGVSFNHSSPVMNACTISDNSASWYGGGVYCSFSSPKLTNCIIESNVSDYEGGGVFCENSSSPLLRGCIILGNWAKFSGGGVKSTSSLFLTHCSVVENTMVYGTGGGLSCLGSDTKLENCIVWGNDPTEIYPENYSTFSVVRWCLIQGGAVKWGNIQGDPRFVKPWDGISADLHLLPDSPCIDAGDPDGNKYDACLPPGLGSLCSDMGAYGGPSNCVWLPGYVTGPTPTPTLPPTGVDWLRYTK